MSSKGVTFHSREQVSKKATCLIKRVLQYMRDRKDHEADLIVQDCKYLLKEFEDADYRTTSDDCRDP
jgi:hypothetical protein